MKPCLVCGLDYQQTAYNQRVCPSCAPGWRREQNRERLRRFREARGAIPLGTTLNCSACGKEFVYKAGPQRRCEECQRKKEVSQIHEWLHANPGKLSRYRRKAKENYYFGGLWKAVRERDGNACVRCGARSNLHVHHIDGRGKGVKADRRNNAIGNLVTLCMNCHRRLHAETERFLYERHPESVLEMFRSFVTNWKAA